MAITLRRTRAALNAAVTYTLLSLRAHHEVPGGTPSAPVCSCGRLTALCETYLRLASAGLHDQNASVPALDTEARSQPSGLESTQTRSKLSP